MVRRLLHKASWSKYVNILKVMGVRFPAIREEIYKYRKDRAIKNPDVLG